MFCVILLAPSLLEAELLGKVTDPCRNLDDTIYPFAEGKGKGPGEHPELE
jgi:hypothetical protein